MAELMAGHHPKDLDEQEVEPVHQTAGNHSVYVVVVDDTEEFLVSLRYAARMAHKQNAHVGIIYVIDEDGFHHWGGVESMIQKELREKAEMFLWETARTVNELNNMKPVLYIAEGPKTDAIVQTITQDPCIRMLVLSGRTSSGGPGPLVSYFAGKGLERLPVPMTLVPGNMLPHKIDSNLGVLDEDNE